MVAGADIRQMMSGQILGSTKLPKVDLSGKTMIVTGANTGLGLECAKHLNVSKGEAAKASILKETGCKDRTTIEVWEVDLDHYSSAVAFGKRIRSQLSRLDGLVANAGVEHTKFNLSEGLESSLTVNVISTFLIALSALPKLKETSKAYETQTNLTIIGSVVHIFGPTTQLEAPEGIDVFEALSDPNTADMTHRYPLSKLILHQCSKELAQRVSSSAGVEQHQVVINWVNPGWCQSELARHRTYPLGQKIGFALIGRTAEQGGRTLVHGVTAGKETHGHYLSECQIKPESLFVRSSAGQQMQKRLWNDLMRRIESISPEIAGFVN